MRLQLILLTALDSVFQAQCEIVAVLNHSQEYNNKDSDVNLGKNETIHRYNNDNNQYKIYESDIKFRDLPSSPSISTSTSTIVNTISNSTNFLITDFLSDGEVERRISYNGVIAKETRLLMNE